VLNDHLSSRKYVVGSSYSVADVNLASIFVWSGFAKIKLDAFPHVARWLGECTSRPAAKKVLGR
jgi:glutathione S-transferase